MRGAIDETDRRRAIQTAYNEEHGIQPASIVKEIRDLTARVRSETAQPAADLSGMERLPTPELQHVIEELEAQMRAAAQELEFEKAALLRDQVFELREILSLQKTGRTDVPIWEQDRLMPISDEAELWGEGS